MRRQTKRCGVLRKPHAAPVHRLYVHAPERLNRNRTGVRAHAVTIARRSCPRLQPPLLVLLFWRFLRQISQTFCAVTQLFLTQQMARPPHQACRREIVPAAVVLRFKRAAIPGRNVVRPERVVGLCPGTTRRHRRSSTAAEKLKWNESKISERCAGLGRLPSAGSDGEIKRTGVRWLPAVARACLHIGFCKFSRRQSGAVLGVQVPPDGLSR